MIFFKLIFFILVIRIFIYNKPNEKYDEDFDPEKILKFYDDDDFWKKGDCSKIHVTLVIKWLFKKVTIPIQHFYKSKHRDCLHNPCN